MASPRFRDILATELAKRRLKNARYSQRSLAKSLGIDPGLFSKIMAGKHIPSPSTLTKVAIKLAWTGEEKQVVAKALAEERRLHEVGGESQPAVKPLNIDEFEVISRLFHYAILELTFVEGFASNSRWIARRLGLTVIEVDAAVARLIRLGLLVDDNGTWKKSEKHIQISDKEKTTPALRDQQKEILDRARSALDHVAIDQRSTTGMTMSIDPDKLPVAKKMIDDFMFQLCEVLESGKRKNVYQLSVSLFPLDKQ